MVVEDLVDASEDESLPRKPSQFSRRQDIQATKANVRQGDWRAGRVSMMFSLVFKARVFDGTGSMRAAVLHSLSSRTLCYCIGVKVVQFAKALRVILAGETGLQLATIWAASFIWPFLLQRSRRRVRLKGKKESLREDLGYTIETINPPSPMSVEAPRALS